MLSVRRNWGQKILFLYGNCMCLLTEKIDEKPYDHVTVISLSIPGKQTQASLAGLSSAIVCGHSQSVCPQFSSQNDCFCNVSPDQMTHWGHVNIYLHLFLTVIRPERFWGQHMSQICNHSLSWKSWSLLLAFCDHIIHKNLEGCSIKYLVRQLGMRWCLLF